MHPAYAHRQALIFKKIFIESTRLIAVKFLEVFVIVMKCFSTISGRSWLSILIWASLWKLFIYIEFGSLYIIITLFAGIFSNLGQKEEGDLSAYSVFNKGFTTLLGQSTGQQFDNEIRHNNNMGDDDEDRRDLPNGEVRAAPQKGTSRRFVSTTTLDDQQFHYDLY
jgi:Uncharacterized conserved domain (SAYSvFN)